MKQINGHIQCSYVHMSSKYMNKSMFIFFHMANFRSLFILQSGPPWQEHNIVYDMLDHGTVF